MSMAPSRPEPGCREPRRRRAGPHDGCKPRQTQCRKPRLPRGVRLKYDETRGEWLLLAPERVIKADAIAVEILKRCDGTATFAAIVDDLAQQFSADRARVEADVRALLGGPRGQAHGGSMSCRARQELSAPVALLAELTHRCPLGCPYCSNPLALDPRERRTRDLATGLDVFSQAAKLGVLHAHLSGGEPAARQDLTEIVAHCAKVGLYTNLITSGIGLTQDRVKDLADAGLDHAQLSIQDSDAASADKIAGYKGAFARKAGGRGMDRGGRSAAHCERRHSPGQYQPRRKNGRACREASARAGSRSRIRNITAGGCTIAPR